VSSFRDQTGQATLLVIGVALVCFAVAGIAVDGARAWSLRRTLQNAADAAATSGAGALDTGRYYTSGGTATRLEPALARRRAAEVAALRGTGARMLFTVTAGVVRTRLRARLRTSFLRLVGIGALPVAAEAEARGFYGRP